MQHISSTCFSHIQPVPKQTTTPLFLTRSGHPRGPFYPILDQSPSTATLSTPNYKDIQRVVAAAFFILIFYRKDRSSPPLTTHAISCPNSQYLPSYAFANSPLARALLPNFHFSISLNTPPFHPLSFPTFSSTPPH